MNARAIVWSRRVVQTASALLFVAAVVAAGDPTGNPADPAGAAARALDLVFDLDPLAQVAAALATRTLAGLSLLFLLTLALTAALGRVFCGWLCPLGAIFQLASQGRRLVRRVLPKSESFSRWQRARVPGLVALLVLALLGSQWVGVLDPLSLLLRTTGTALLPASRDAVEGVSTAVYQADPLHLSALTEPVYGWLRDHVYGPERPVFSNSGVVMGLFTALLGLNLVRPRWWCRYACPLGGLLGLVARRPLLRLVPVEGGCSQCGLCTLSCPAAAQPEKAGQWLPTECFGCWNCVDSCKNGGLAFRFTTAATPAGTVDLGRRRMAAAALGGVGGLLLVRTAPVGQGRAHPPLRIRPPGARPEPEFLDRCIQCGLCMQACPTNALHPAWAEAGLEGLWTPVLVPRLGYCEYECNRCGQVCPTEAIQPLPLDEKKRVHVGLAMVDRSRCLPWAWGRECIVCEEHCPIPDKAIRFEEGEDGLKRPVVDPDLCTGCGICETMCPFVDVAAIRVTSAGESRDPSNQPILQGGGRTHTPARNGVETRAVPAHGGSASPRQRLLLGRAQQR